MQRIVSLSLSVVITLSAFAQNKTKEGYSLSWDKEIVTGHDTILSGAVKVPAATVPVYEARTNEVADLLKKALPMASFKESGGVYTANAVNLSTTMPAVDVLATAKDDKKGGFTSMAFAFLQNGVPVSGDAGVLASTARELGVKMNKAVAQKQLDVWQGKLDKAVKEQQSVQADKEKATEKVNKANDDLGKTVKKRGDLQREISNTQADITRQETRWATSQDPKDLKKLTKLKEKQTKSEKKLADAMAQEAKQTKTANKRQDELPDAHKDHEKVTESKEEVQRTVDALRQKLDSIR